MSRGRSVENPFPETLTTLVAETTVNNTEILVQPRRQWEWADITHTSGVDTFLIAEDTDAFGNDCGMPLEPGQTKRFYSSTGSLGFYVHNPNAADSKFRAVVLEFRDLEPVGTTQVDSKQYGAYAAGPPIVPGLS